MNNFPPEPMLAKTCAELRCILNAWSHDWTTEFRQAINELTRRAEDRDLARALKKQLDAVNEKHAEACRVLRNFQAGFEERGKNLLAIAQGLGITYLADYAPEVAGPQEALLRAIDDLRNRADTAEANYAKARDIALRKNERDNDLDQAQVNDAQDATWRWSYETSAKANPGSSMAKVIEAGDEMQRVLLRNFDIVNRANERLTGKMKAIEAGAVITGIYSVTERTRQRRSATLGDHTPCSRPPAQRGPAEIERLTKERDEARAELAASAAVLQATKDDHNAYIGTLRDAAGLPAFGSLVERISALRTAPTPQEVEEAIDEVGNSSAGRAWFATLKPDDHDGDATNFKRCNAARETLRDLFRRAMATKGLISFYTPICTHCGWRGSGETTEEASHRQLTTHIEACPKLRERENAAVVAQLRIGLANLDSLLAVPPWDVRSTWRADAFEDVRRSLQRRIAELTPKPEGETP